jgi:glycosyltransferase involved in cell wall biosynthesis
MSKPLVTFMMFAYNHERFVREAVRGALAQSYSPLEIVISDDCSQDRTFEIIEEEVAGYDGPHKIILNRNEENLGTAAHINRLMELAEGELIVAAASDDVSLPTRTEEQVRVWSERGAYSIYSNAVVIDENGVDRGAFANDKGVFAESPPAPIKSWQNIVRYGRGFVGCTHAWDWAVFDTFGLLPEDVISEDLTISFRSALIGELAYVDKCLVKYRRHGTNLSKDKEHVLQMDLPQFTEWAAADSRMEKVHYESWLRDAFHLRSIRPEMEAETLQAVRSIRARIALCELTASIKNSRWDRWSRCLGSIKYVKDIGVTPVVKSCVLSLSPRIYLNAQKWRIRLGR